MTKDNAFIEIKTQVAKHGKVNKYAMRAYCESKLSRRDFNTAVEIGIYQYNITDKMDKFLDEVDRLCYEYGYQIYPTKEGWTGKTDESGKLDTIAIIGNDEVVEVTYIDGDGRGK